MTAPIVDLLPRAPDVFRPDEFAEDCTNLVAALPKFRLQLNAVGEYVSLGVETIGGYETVCSAAAYNASASAQAAASSAAAAQFLGGVYESIDEGRDAVADGELFKVLPGGVDDLTRLTLYRRDSDSTQTAITELVTAFDLFALPNGDAENPPVRFDSGRSMFGTSEAIVFNLGAGPRIDMLLQDNGNTGIEFGRTDGVASIVYFDFHVGAAAVDYDARIRVSGGTGSNAGATLQLQAGQVLMPSGTAAAPGIAFIAEPDCGFSRTGANAFDAVAGGVSVLEFRGDGPRLPLGFDGAGMARMGKRTLTSGATLVALDAGKLIDCSGTFTLAYTAAATLGANWFCWVRNSGTGVITHDPNGAEQIDGVATWSQPAGTLALIRCTGSAFEIVSVADLSMRWRPLFAAGNAARQARDAAQPLHNSVEATGLAGVIERIVHGGGLFISATSSSSASVASSPDGKTWTLRAMPASAAWNPASNGSNWIATSTASANVAVSSGGTSWSSGTALPAAAKATYCRPACNAGTWLVLGTTTTQCYRSVNNGSSWSTETLPAASGNANPYVVGGLFWYWAGSTGAYTSATGATGSWTLRPLPVVPGAGMVYQDLDGALIFRQNAAGNYYRSPDGINWTDLGFGPGATGAIAMLTIEGVQTIVSDTFGVASTRHAGKAVFRTCPSTQSHLSTACAATDGAGVYLLANTGGAITRIAPNEADAAKGLFEG